MEWILHDNFQNLPITKLVDALMEMKSSQETDDYRYFDPKLIRVTDSSSIPRNRQPFQEVTYMRSTSLQFSLFGLRVKNLRDVVVTLKNQVIHLGENIPERTINVP